ncbi:MAG: hypothetical protein WBG86_04565 [Polyangiales bacterium]
MLKRLILSVLMVTVGCARIAPHAGTVPVAPFARYEVTIFDNLGGAAVRACFEGFTPTMLKPMYRSAARNLTSASSETGVMRVEDGRFAFPTDSGDGCVSYRTRFSGHTFRNDEPPVVIVSQSQWLWRPHPFPTGLRTVLAFVLPKGARASVPFAGGPDAFVLGRDAFYRDAYTVFGEYAEMQFRAGGVAVSAALLGPSPAPAKVRSWLSRAIGAAASVGAAFPADRLQFVIVPIEETDRPVAFGMVRRGGGSSVLVLPSSRATLEDLEADWVVIHELSHLWLPRLRQQDRWLTEGIATYLQELLRARCGLQSAEASWERILDGFARGDRSGTGRELRLESRDMNRTGAYHRVYWGGAAFALEADVRLREATGGAMTLTRALAASHRQLREGPGLLSASEVLSILDDTAGTDLLVALGALYAESSTAPDEHLLDAVLSTDLRSDIMKLDPDRCVLNVELLR